MLTFLSGWRSPDRDAALLKHRDPTRHAVFFIDNLSSLPHLLGDLPVIDVWRNGTLDFQIDDTTDMLIRINHDTDHDLIVRSVAHMLLSGSKSQPIVLTMPRRISIACSLPCAPPARCWLPTSASMRPAATACCSRAAARSLGATTCWSLKRRSW